MVSFGNFKFNERRKEIITQELTELVEKMSHLTLKNFLHQKTVAQQMANFFEEKLVEVFKEVENGFQEKQQEKELPGLTPEQIRRRNNSKIVTANGDMIQITERGKVENIRSYDKFGKPITPIKEQAKDQS